MEELVTFIMSGKEVTTEDRKHLINYNRKSVKRKTTPDFLLAVWRIGCVIIPLTVVIRITYVKIMISLDSSHSLQYFIMTRDPPFL